uniref:Uncharacterized protein n=1 Tax=Strombidium inclinatum TaxID=197538 RepID=A0A7S3N1L1_9SPIT|mmetsp:Transcript_39652/g.60730  ORF Transcript_39652/g.60730 Transcript_39652/m.60730 type:complete len:151 (+) Transcript_39652:297-749(+)
MASIKAADQKEWRYWAQISLELANSLNILITTLFWTLLAPQLFPHLHWHGKDLIVIFHLTVIHSLPLISSLTSFYLTDVEYVQKDWKTVGIVGSAYMIANYMGQEAMGAPLYPPFLDWTKPVLTFFLFCLMTVIYLVIFHYLAKIKASRR